MAKRRNMPSAATCKRDPVKRRHPGLQCPSCKEHFTKIHRCRAANGQYRDLQQSHNIPQDFNTFKYHADTFNFKLKGLANPYEPVKLNEFCEDVERGSSCVDVEKIAACEIADGGATQQCSGAKNTNSNTPIRKGVKGDTSHASSYVNKPRNELIAELQQNKAENLAVKEANEKLKSQRNRLFQYSKKLEANTKKAITKVNHFTAQHRYIVDRSYAGCYTDNLPPWCTGRCKRCGSSVRHEDFDCAARGYMCTQCFKFNHFTTVCLSAPCIRLTAATFEERNLLIGVENDIAASK